MNENDSILELLDMLINMVSDARSMPLGNDRCIIERSRALDMLDDVRSRLPAEVSEARRLIAKREDFINNAKREGESIRRVAEERARKLVEEEEIVRQAKQRADEIVADAEQKAQQVRNSTLEFVARQLSNTEQTVAQTLDMVRETSSRFRAAVGNASGRKPYDDSLD